MASYVVPQVEVHQLFSEIPVELATSQVPFVFGPNYLLHRYTTPAEKLSTYLGYYDSESSDTKVKNLFAPYPGALDEEKVEQTYTKLYGDNVYVKLGTFDNVTRVVDPGESSASADDVTIPDQLNITEDDSSDPEIDEIAVGRTLRLVIGDSYKDVTITSIVEDGTTGDTVRVEIDEDLEDTDVVTKAYLCEVQNGVEFPREDFSDTNKTRYFWKEHQDTVTTSSTYGQYGVKVLNTLKAYYNDSDYRTKTPKYGVVLSADLYLTYRELITTAADTIHSLVNASDVATALGTVSPDNPLAQAVYNAALNAGGQTIRYMALDTADLTGKDTELDIEGYSKILDSATLTKEVYFLVPATRSSAILTLVKRHVEAMSEATVKRWRIAFISAEIPESDSIYTSTNNTDGSDFNAKVLSIDHTAVKPVAVIQVGSKSGSTWTGSTTTKFKKDLVEGDVVYFNYSEEWGEKVPKKFTIAKIMSNNTVRVYDPDKTLVTDEYANPKIEIHHPYTTAEKAEVIRDLSSKFATRRLYNVFPSVFSADGIQQTGEFAAACVAGLVSSCLPQQPVTNLELTGIDDVPMVYQTFTYDELNTMASGGTFIVMQDLPNEQVYIRHQISTDYESNNLNTAELSITKNLDSISYYFDDLLSPYIGKYNITPDLLQTLENVINAGITDLTTNSYGLYGAQLIADGTSLLTIEQDALLKDHVNCNLQLEMPYPFNHLVLKLFV